MNEEKTPPAVSPLLLARSHITTEGNKTGSWRFLRPRYEEKTPPCSVACPAGEDIGLIEELTNQGMFKEAWETILRENPFPGVCGSVCYHPCEAACNRGEFDEAIAINAIERFLADAARRNDVRPSLSRSAPRREKVAIVGGGPAGLSAAYFLTMLGYGCDVFDGMSEPGGVLRWGIPEFRLPLAILQRDIALIEAQGVRIQGGVQVSEALMRDMDGDYDAVFIACGYTRSRSLGIPGEDLDGIEDGRRFLHHIRLGNRPRLEGLQVIIGGGNTAIDVARTVRRLGGTPLIAYRRRLQDMPAFADEIAMARYEGIALKELVAPLAITPHGDGYILTLGQMHMTGEDDRGRAIVAPDEGAAEELAAAQVFTAIGEEAAQSWCIPPRGDGVVRLNAVVCDFRSGRACRVFGGDLTTDTKSVVDAVASGKEAAIALDILFREGLDAVEPGIRECLVGDGRFCSMEIYRGGTRCHRSSHVVPYDEINADYFQLSRRISQPRLLMEERVATFDAVDLKISASMAIREAERCFNCGLCNQCDNCYLFCPDLSIVRDTTPPGRHIDYDYCKGCGLCVAECPRNAMVLEEETDETGTGGEPGRR